MTTKLTGVGIGCGYFSRFHYEAWNKDPRVQLAAVCDLDAAKAEEMAATYGIPGVYTDHWLMIERERPDFIDIITPPETHLPLVRELAPLVKAVICQKPLAPTVSEAREIVALAAENNCLLMVHENWRWQPWYRTIKRLLEAGTLGKEIYSFSWQMRMGDGWSSTAYLDRQPYFRQMPRLLIYETGIHFIDTYRYLFGEVHSVFARLMKRNPSIAGEDAAIVHFQFKNGAQGLWDAGRYNEPNYPDPRLTFGSGSIDGSAGTLRLYPDGRISFQALGKAEAEVDYAFERTGFAGDCVRATQMHFIDGLLEQRPFETDGADYLENLRIQEAIYHSARIDEPVVLDKFTLAHV